MSINNLDKMFHPKSIAVIEASQNPEDIGYNVMTNLIACGYKGIIYPIHPKAKKIMGITSYKSLSKVILSKNSSIDLVICTYSISSAPLIINECIQANVKSIILLAGTRKESGSKEYEIEEIIKKSIEKSSLRVIASNYFGVICNKSKLNASMMKNMPCNGKVAFISQSGAIAASILDMAIQENIGFSHFISLGSMIDVNFADMIDYLGNDSDVSAILIYIENLYDFRDFMSAARAVARIKPIIALKAGRTNIGKIAASTHTGSLTGEDATYDVAFKRAGILRVKTFEELFDCAELTGKQPRPKNNALAIITNAGGPGVIAVDTLSDYGVLPVMLSQNTIYELNEVLPQFWSHSNPIDILGDATPERYQKVINICMNAPEINGLLIMLTPQAMTNPETIAQSLIDIIKKKPYPIFTAWIGGATVQKARNLLNKAGIPTFDTPERAVRAFMDMYKYTENLKILQEIPPKLPSELYFEYEKVKDIIEKKLAMYESILNEIDSKHILSLYGIPTNKTLLATSEDQALEIADTLQYPLAFKICSPDIPHKNEVNGVCLNIKNKQELKSSFNKVIINVTRSNPNTKIDGFSLQQMVKKAKYELILGAKQDRDFGPVILFGMGGIKAEFFNDKAICLPPLNRLLAKNMMQETRIYKILKQDKNISPDILMQLEEMLIRLSQLVTDFSEIYELDINPVIITQEKVIAVDAEIILKSSSVKAPMHLIISPYPNQYETYYIDNEDEKIAIRPVKPEDAPLLVNLFNTLSKKSIYLRFFGPLKRLEHKMLAKFTQIDYDREIALVAIKEINNNETMVGTARLIKEANQKVAEFSVIVGDPWHGKGIGASLLQNCIDIARLHNIETIWGVVLAENTQMLKLGQKLGFTIQRTEEYNEYELYYRLN